MTVFGKVQEPWWDDAPVIIVGAGPSLAGFDFNRLRGLGHILALNQKAWDLPFADACFSLDIQWMGRDPSKLEELAARTPLYLAVPDQKQPIHEHVSGAIYLRRDRQCGPLSEDPSTIEAGGTTGFGGLNLAYLKRGKRIFLFGYDYDDGGLGHDKPEQYPWHPPGHNARYWPRWAVNFGPTVSQLARAGVEVTNVLGSRPSNVKAYPTCTIEQTINTLADQQTAKAQRNVA